MWTKRSTEVWRRPRTWATTWALPVTASVKSTNTKDTLTYGLRAYVHGTDLGATGVTTPVDAAADVAAFDIDKASGQITVARKLDFESRGVPDDGKYVVVVEVRDPSADSTADPTTGYDFIRGGHHGRRQETKTRCCRDGRS